MAFFDQILSILNYFSTEIILIGFIPILLYWYSVKNQSYWKDRNVPYVKPLPIIGSLLENMTTPYCDLELKRYFSLGPIYGQFEFSEPTLTISDPKLIRDILVKDFALFVNKKSYKTGYRLSDSMLSFAEGEDWKRLRTIVSPTFTTGKLKRILNILKECCSTIVTNFKVSAEKSESVDVKRFIDAFTLDFVASAAFSTKIDSHNDPENKFVQHSKKFYGNDFKIRLCLLSFLSSWPQFRKLIKLSVFDSKALEYFKSLSLQIISERQRTKQTRDDFLQLLLDTAKKSTDKEKRDDIEDDDDLLNNYGPDTAGQGNFNIKNRKNLTDEEIVALCNNFFGGTSDTISTVLTFTMYLLATNEDIQEKAYQEIAQHLHETGGKLTYDVLKKLKYMDNIISESLRLYPPFMRLSRRVGKEYKLGDTGITLEKDLIIFFPVIAIHRNPKFYPNPEKFDPDRFSPEEVAKRDPYVFLPFGHGPRNCVGMRFGLIITKVFLVYIMCNFKIKTCSQTKIPMEFDTNSFVVLHSKGLNVALEIRHDSPLVE